MDRVHDTSERDEKSIQNVGQKFNIEESWKIQEWLGRLYYYSMDRKETESEGVAWIHLGKDKDDQQTP